MTYAAFLLSVAVLLLVPGPTNTLMGLTGAERGLARAAYLLPFELAGYATTVIPLTIIGAELVNNWPHALIVLKVLAAMWVMWLAVRLWHAGLKTKEAGEGTPASIYLTTVLNPKATIFGLVLLPPPTDPLFLSRFASFCAIVMAAALLWAGIGVLANHAQQGESRMRLLQRVASAWLALVSVMLVVSVLR